MQWDIMRRAFGSDGSTLVLIGDPKQAIYAFRGADVFSYLGAADEASTKATLGTNWRSDQGLIDAYDALFSGSQLGHAGIGYRKVVAAASERRVPSDRCAGRPVTHPGRRPQRRRVDREGLCPAQSHADVGGTGSRGGGGDAPRLGRRGAPVRRIRAEGRPGRRGRARTHQRPGAAGLRSLAERGGPGGDQRLGQRVRHGACRRVAAPARCARATHGAGQGGIGGADRFHRLASRRDRDNRCRRVGGPALVAAPMVGHPPAPRGRRSL